MPPCYLFAWGFVSVWVRCLSASAPGDLPRTCERPRRRGVLFWQSITHIVTPSPSLSLFAHSVALRHICALQIAYYVSASVLLLWEVSRKDQAMMMVHHCATIVLTGACYACDYTRAGVAIMLLHDINDVIMELAKICSYTRRHLAANALFVLFIVTWVALRMVAFPAVIIRSTMWEVLEVLGFPPPCYRLINTLFCLLYCIHVYWFFLILRVAWRMRDTGKAEDVREQDEE